MNTGLGFSEILLIGTLVLVFFGSKELPAFIREAAKLLAKVRRYSEKLKNEINEISRSVEAPVKELSSTLDSIDTTANRKAALRKHYITVRKNLDALEHKRLSEIIGENLMQTKEFINASSVMVYVSTGGEVSTRKFIEDSIGAGKRIVVPYILPNTLDLGIAEIKDFDKDLVSGELGILEPAHSLRTHFFKSDIKLVVCPGVAFDANGGRLGRGKAYYDNFLREFKGRVPIFGIAFECQIMNDTLPFDYHDVSMDQVITESGLLIKTVSNITDTGNIQQTLAG
ncbi:MAG: 5-formyltetrahydrofolate cyclo-ligase [Fibrobacter sp.]|nr:5-formyltetrahydrofolate cyclo-ligase [Fibrobacter sp.]